MLGSVSILSILLSMKSRKIFSRRARILSSELRPNGRSVTRKKYFKQCCEKLFKKVTSTCLKIIDVFGNIVLDVDVAVIIIRY